MEKQKLFISALFMGLALQSCELKRTKFYDAVSVKDGRTIPFTEGNTVKPILYGDSVLVDLESRRIEHHLDEFKASFKRTPEIDTNLLFVVKNSYYIKH